MNAPDLQLGYAGMIVLGLMALGASRVTKDLRAPGERRQYYTIQVVTIVCALVGAKLGVLMGDAHWPIEPFHDWALLAGTGRSIAGALLFGFIGAELAKPLMRYRLPPNDRFATVLPFSIAIGRIGCLLAG
ncbi:MAG TPA: prolipoprotein diacylglyceryl transferase family protein, partial [Xanthomonadales bacterium]|nr:prolipoprotein diacylglyceryl transferase family protein [Xanthomonadales bacterium]